MYNRDEELEKQRLLLDPQEQKVCLVCERCNKEIYYKEEYYMYEGYNLCEECIDEILSDTKFEARREAGVEDDY